MSLKQISLCLIFFCLTSPALLHADIATDGTVGAAQTLTGPDYAIPETLGTVKGSNLFHSFDKFSIKTQESATFTGSDSIKNVISRVTGGEKSEIDGTLRSNVGKADFYFINPSGVVFGQNAKVDVPAAFHASTGNELKFADGSSFKASKTEQSTLTQAAPESFGFLGTQSASIEVNGSTLEFKPESKVSLTSSKDITIKGTKSGTEEKQASLVNAGGEIELKAKGDLFMDNASVESSGNGGGKIDIKTDNIALHNNSKIITNNISDKDSVGGVTIEVDNKIMLYNNSQISSNTLSQGKAGEVNVKTYELEILNGSTISSNTGSKGDAYIVTVNTHNIKIDGQGYLTGIASIAAEGSQGNAGKVQIFVVGLVEMLNGAILGSATYGQGDGGSVIIEAGDITIAKLKNDNSLTGVIAGSFKDFGGKGGIVNITVDGLLKLCNGTRISSDTLSKKNAGEVIVKAGNLEILNSSTISSNTGSKGDAYIVTVNARNIKIDGQGNDLTGIASIAADGSEGNAGKVIVIADDYLKMFNGATLGCGTSAKGDGGNVRIEAGNIKIDGQGTANFTGIASAASKYAEGYVGSVSVIADSVTILNGAQISIAAYQKLSEEKFAKIANIDEKYINLNTKQLTIKSESKITSESTENVPASDININADSIYLHDGLITTSVFGTNGDGGNISINENAESDGFLVMQNGLIQANTLAEGAKGGRIRINADNLIADKSMPFQIGGEPEAFSLDDKKNIIQAADPSKNPQDIEAPEVPIDLGGSIINASSKFSEPVKMAENQCRFIGTKRASHLTRGGKGGIPQMLSEPSSIFITDERLEEFLRYEEQKGKK
ncbi:MAG: filamentous hemagglutinin N-terminal domain-containing protein [Desulfamplus sp.]|nr:filamentous hemagglutinin N-terminal domain-containing protein [Desulfamplus sp.]